jgi:hypothetical protein
LVQDKPDNARERSDAVSSGTPPTGGAPPPALFVFPKWSNWLREASALVSIGGTLYLVVLLTLVFSPQTSAVGYAPVQPVPYSHALHVGQLGMDCRYCHNTVERAAHAAIPPTQTCMNCHQRIRSQSKKLLPVMESNSSGLPVPWVRVHDLPDFVYFNHSAHLTAGVGCVSCHGRVDKMEVMRQDKPLTMAWCLGCHRDPDPQLRPREFLTVMDWVPDEDPAVLGHRLRETGGINPSTDCSTCHR